MSGERETRVGNKFGGNLSNLNDIVKPTAEGTPRAKEKNEEIVNLQLETERLKLRAQQLEIQEREANLQDIQERLDERNIRRQNIRQTSVTNGLTLKQNADIDARAQKRCNHRKGGNGVAAVLGGQGDDSQYAVLKHTFCNGDMWVRCLRCGYTWKPPIKNRCKSEEEYIQKFAEWQAACNFQTRNVPSGSVVFGFSDNGAYYREMTANTTLR
jgi:hypothetical protein